METAFEILKWVGIVFLTGLIAGFGKLLAERIVRRRQKQKLQAASTVPNQSNTAVPAPEPTAAEPADQRRKTEKKKAKALQKQLKKQAK